jgi:outer membrane cobalamin receptor
MKMPRYTSITFSFAISILLFTEAFSQIEPQDTSHMTKLDSLSRIFIRPIPLIGTIDRNLKPENIVNDSTINFGNYRYAGDLLSLFPSILSFDFGSLGLLPDITIQGLGMREISFQADGIPLNDPLTGLYNSYLYPTEHIDRMEIVQGTRSFLYGFNSTGGVINFVTKSKKAVHPYSHLRYSESGYGFGIVDGTVSQDIVRGLNVTMGAQHTVY